MKYTVIVPVFNGEDTIGDCLKSLIDQKDAIYGEDYKVLVVDDGSTDKTPHIANQFPVELIKLERNEGRIIARLTGAKNAGTGRILFVDSRVTIPDDTICKLHRLAEFPAVIGEHDHDEHKYETTLHTVLYLIRKKYYGREQFPIRDSLLINKKNFARAPKGTAVLLIDRDLFIKITPERTGKHVNDDTLLFHNLLFEQGKNLVRSRELFFQYSQRTDLKQFSAWLFHRGVRFSDFYLRPGGYFFIPFMLLLLTTASILVAFVAASISGYSVLFRMAAVAIAINSTLSFYLAENRRDFMRSILALPLVLIIFASGVAYFWSGMTRGNRETSVQ